MATSYTTKTAALRATTIDSAIIDTKKLLVKTPEDTNSSRTDIIEYINNVPSYAKKDEANIFTETNTFDNGVISNNSISITGGNILLNKNCSIKFLDDGEITITGSVSGYPIINGIPTSISNSTIYNVGLISSDTDLSGMMFDGDETIVQSCEVWFITGDTIYNITWPTGTYWIDYDDGAMPTLYTNTKYRIVLRKEIDDLIASISHFYPAS